MAGISGYSLLIPRSGGTVGVTRPDDRKGVASVSGYSPAGHSSTKASPQRVSWGGASIGRQFVISAMRSGGTP